MGKTSRARVSPETAGAPNLPRDGSRAARFLSDRLQRASSRWQGERGSRQRGRSFRPADAGRQDDNGGARGVRMTAVVRGASG
jgi:hypothetical protein